MAKRKTKAQRAAEVSANGHAGTPPRCPEGWQPLAEVEETVPHWLWPHRIPACSLSLIEGRKGVGKSTLLAAICANVTGGPQLPGAAPSTVGRVIWLISEEDAGAVVRPRLTAAGCDISHVITPQKVARGPLAVKLTLPSQLSRLEDVIANVSPALVVMDPWTSFVDAGADLYHEQSVRGVLEPLVEIAHRLRCSFLLTRHLRKGTNGPAIDQGMGSTGVGNVCRSILRVDRHPQDKTVSTLSQVASNLGSLAPTLKFRIVQEGTSTRCEWMGQSSLDAEALADASGDGAERDARADARELLRSICHDDFRPAKDVLSEAKVNGIGERTLRAAKATLGVVSRRKQVGEQAFWEWGPPPAGWPEE